MNDELLNVLIEAESLLTMQLDDAHLNGYIEHIHRWQKRVESVVLFVQPNMSEMEKGAIGQLAQYSELLVQRLTVFRKEMQAAQQRMIKRHAAVTAYSDAV